MEKLFRLFGVTHAKEVAEDLGRLFNGCNMTAADVLDDEEEERLQLDNGHRESHRQSAPRWEQVDSPEIVKHASLTSSEVQPSAAKAEETVDPSVWKEWRPVVTPKRFVPGNSIHSDSDIDPELSFEDSPDNRPRSLASEMSNSSFGLTECSSEFDVEDELSQEREVEEKLREYQRKVFSLNAYISHVFKRRLPCCRGSWRKRDRNQRKLFSRSTPRKEDRVAKLEN